MSGACAVDPRSEKQATETDPFQHLDDPFAEPQDAFELDASHQQTHDIGM